MDENPQWVLATEVAKPRTLRLDYFEAFIESVDVGHGHWRKKAEVSKNQAAKNNLITTFGERRAIRPLAT